jgi:hypothetical protein
MVRARIHSPRLAGAVDEAPSSDDRLRAVLGVADARVNESEALTGVWVERLGVVRGHAPHISR